MEFFDTHCHIHEILGDENSDNTVYSKWRDAAITDPDSVINDAVNAGVSTMICVGTTLQDSQLAVEFTQSRSSCFASIGIHPHEAEHYKGLVDKNNFEQLVTKKRVVAIGECGLDYFYKHSGRLDQQSILRFQLKLARKYNMPLIFHIREAFDDFWPIFDENNTPDKPLRGVIHSFTDSIQNVEQALKRGLYIGLNGIITFTTDSKQLEMAKCIPLQNLLLETDAPFLTPVPYRGKMCEPKHVVTTAEFLAGLRGESLEQLAAVTTANARRLFLIS